MIEWSEQHLMIRDAVRRFVDAEIVPNLEQLEHGDMPPYDILRKMLNTFGMDEMARARFKSQIAREKAVAAGEMTESQARSGEFNMTEHVVCVEDRRAEYEAWPPILGDMLSRSRELYLRVCKMDEMVQRLYANTS